MYCQWQKIITAPVNWRANTVNCGSAHPGALGELCARYRCEKSFFGYNPSVLKSGIQKYARRAEIQKGLWCLVEMDLFSLLEWDGAALDGYLRNHPKETRANTQASAKRIRTNMVNRLVVMMSEEVGISAWWMPSMIHELYQSVDGNSRWSGIAKVPGGHVFVSDIAEDDSLDQRHSFRVPRAARSM